jgi:tetratricopeptide (TPR) repeat protein
MARQLLQNASAIVRGISSFVYKDEICIRLIRTIAWMDGLDRALQRAEDMEEDPVLKLHLKLHSLSELTQIAVQMDHRQKAKEFAALAQQMAEELDPWFSKEYFHKIAEVLAQIGEFDQALAVAEKIGDQVDRSRAWKTIVQECVRMDNINLAKQVAGRMVEIANSTADNGMESNWLMCETAQALALIGERDRAFEIVNQILLSTTTNFALYDDTRTGAQIGLGKALAKAGMIEQAALVVETIDTEGHNHLFVLVEVARARAAAGDFEGAMKTVQQIQDPDWRAQALDKIAHEMIQAGKVDQAIEAAENIAEDQGFKPHVLINITWYWAELGEHVKVDEIVQKALAAAEEIKRLITKADAFTWIAKTLGQQGTTNKAIKIAYQAWEVAKELEDKTQKAQVLERIVEVFAYARGIDQAYEVASEIEDETYRVRAIIHILCALTVVGQFDKAVSEIETFSQELYRIWARIDLAYTLASLDEQDWAAYLAEKALAFVDSIDGYGYRADSFLQLANLFAQLGQKEKATTTAFRAIEQLKEFENDRDRQIKLAEAIQILVLAGQQEQASEIWVSELQPSKLTRRRQVFGMLSDENCVLAIIPKIEIIWDIFQAFKEIENWWYREKGNYDRVH